MSVHWFLWHHVRTDWGDALQYSGLHVNVINRSITLVLNHSVAGGYPEVAVTVLRIQWLHLVWLDGQFGRHLILFFLICEMVERLFLFDLSECKEQIQSRLPQGNDMLKNIPKDTFRERCGRQRAGVGPSSVLSQ